MDGFQWSPSFVGKMQDTEGFSPVPQWDYKQYSWGYGTRWQPGMPTSVTPETAKNYLFDELGKARTAVASRWPDLPQNVQEGLSSFTYNLGPNWLRGDNALTDAITRGDWNAASHHMLAYDHAGGVENKGLYDRRNWEGGLIRDPNFLGMPVSGGAQTAQPAQNVNVAANGAINSVGPSVDDVTGGSKMPIQTTKTFGGAPMVANVTPASMRAVSEDDLAAARAQAISDELNKMALGGTRLPGSGLEGASHVLGAIVGAYEGKQADKSTLNKRMAMADILGGSDPMVRLAAATGNDNLLNTIASKQVENQMTLPEYKQTGVDRYGNPTYGFIDRKNQTVSNTNGGDQASAVPSAGIDPKLQGSDFLSALEKVDKPRADTLRMFAEGRGNFPMGAEARTPQGRALLDDMNRAFPGFDQSQYTARNKMRASYAGQGNGTGGGILSLGGTAIQHLADLSDQNMNIDKTNMGPQGIPFVSEFVNGQQNSGAMGTGSPRAVALHAATTARDNATGEITKFYTSTGGSRADRKDRLDNFDFAASAAEKQAAIKVAADEMQDKLNQMEFQWKQQFGDSVPFPGLSPEAKAAFDRIQKNYNVANGLDKAPGAAPAAPAPVRAAGGATPPVPAPGSTPIQMPPVTVNQGAGGDPLQQARAAIAAGADPVKVKQRLIQNGIDAGGL